MVTCDPVSELNLNYGDMNNWMILNTNKYEINSLDKLNAMNWIESEWLHVYRFYYQNGTVDYEKTIYVMNMFRQFKKDLVDVSPLDINQGNLTEHDD